MSRKSLGHSWIRHAGDVAILDARRWPGSRLVLMCGLCGAARSYDVEKIVDGMHKKRSGGWKTPIGHIARLVGWNCSYCGRHAWRTQLAYPATISEQEARRLARLIRC